MRKDVRCEKCGKLIAKVDDDGTVHVKAGKRMPQVIAEGRVTLICPGEVLRVGEAPLECGQLTHINRGEVASYVR